jgi:hypothetical protein
MNILDNAKQIAEAVHEIKNLELYQRVLDLHSDIIGLVEDNQHLRHENKELQVSLEVKAKMSFRAPFCYQEGDSNPFCPACWEGSRKPVHLIFSHEEETCIRWDCKTCNQTFLINKDRPRRAGNITPGAYFGENGWMAR